MAYKGIGIIMAKKNVQASGVEVKDVTITSKQKTDLELVNQKIIDELGDNYPFGNDVFCTIIQ